MHNWLMRNLTLLAFLLMLGILVFALLVLVPVLGSVYTAVASGASLWQVLVGGGAGLLLAVMYLLGILISYGILLRFVALCDDIAAIRRQQTGTPSSLE
ncbi:MAG: hypothetical protein HC861_04500 [Rhodospirillaceae bacterium]|nr:hypothetical protein [Rhodospirillaceae bacterium]